MPLMKLFILKVLFLYFFWQVCLGLGRLWGTREARGRAWDHNSHGCVNHADIGLDGSFA